LTPISGPLQLKHILILIPMNYYRTVLAGLRHQFDNEVITINELEEFSEDFVDAEVDCLLEEAFYS